MTKRDIAKILAIIAAAYPQFEADDLKVNVWQEMLGDLNYELVQQAVKICILRSDFPPSIAAIRRAATELTNPDELSAAEAWGMVINAIRHYGSYRSTDAFSSMPPEVVEIAKLMGWQEMCRAENVEVIRGQFIKLYEIQVKKVAERAVLPEPVKIKQIAEGR